MTITVREECPGDEATIADVVRRTYADVPYSDHREHIMVDCLRATDAYRPELSLLAEFEDEAVGHVLLTEASIRSDRTSTTTLALAPLSVVPEFRLRRIGSCLISSARDRAAAAGYGSILVVGTPDYFEKFGFERVSHYAIEIPRPLPPEESRILELRPGALDGVAGMVRYATGWLDH